MVWVRASARLGIRVGKIWGSVGLHVWGPGGGSRGSGTHFGEVAEENLIVASGTGVVGIFPERLA